MQDGGLPKGRAGGKGKRCQGENTEMQRRIGKADFFIPTRSTKGCRSEPRRRGYSPAAMKQSRVMGERRGPEIWEDLGKFVFGVVFRSSKIDKKADPSGERKDLVENLNEKFAGGRSQKPRW